MPFLYNTKNQHVAKNALRRERRKNDSRLFLVREVGNDVLGGEGFLEGSGICPIGIDAWNSSVRIDRVILRLGAGSESKRGQQCGQTGFDKSVRCELHVP